MLGEPQISPPQTPVDPPQMGFDEGVQRRWSVSWSAGGDLRKSSPSVSVCYRTGNWIRLGERERKKKTRTIRPGHRGAPPPALLTAGPGPGLPPHACCPPSCPAASHPACGSSCAATDRGSSTRRPRCATTPARQRNKPRFSPRGVNYATSTLSGPDPNL